MTKYLIKVTSTGTDSNPNFAGVENRYYCGKRSSSNVGRTIIERDTDICMLDVSLRYLASEYGYETEASAKRGLTALKKQHDEETVKWNYHMFEHEVIAVEVAA